MKNLLIFIAGIGVGAVGTLVWLRKDFEKKVEEEVEKIAKDIHKNAEENDSNGHTNDGENTKNFIQKEDAEAVERLSERLTDSAGYTNYSGETGADRVILRGFEGENVNVSVEKEPENDEKSDENDENYVSLLKSKSGACARKSGALDMTNSKNEENSSKIYGISPEDFLHTGRDFAKETLIFYEKDGVFAEFVDECATFCANAPLLVGEKWRIEIGKYEENVAYIRNEKIGADYEIIVENSSFSEGKKDDYEEV